ncbi:type II toxin-antitoxin system VapB family antitoxin [Streptomyces sp. NPDC057249]|uniref:type II toxin-antitoxin system VapB family antitoxin n=1 Tax=Streptomyces sp. NPDC057249 TaxID=3346067 RepID=UPI00363EDCEE
MTKLIAELFDEVGKAAPPPCIRDKFRIYEEGCPVGKTLIELDEQALAVAQAAFGTKTKKDTVNRALREVSDRVKRHEARVAAERTAAEALDLDALLDGTGYRPGAEEDRAA